MSAETVAGLAIDGIGVAFGALRGARAFASALFEGRTCAGACSARVQVLDVARDALGDAACAREERVVAIAVGASALLESDMPALASAVGIGALQTARADSLGSALVLAASALDRGADVVLLHAGAPGDDAARVVGPIVFDVAWRREPRVESGGAAAIVLRRAGADARGGRASYAEVASVAVDGDEPPGARSLEAAVRRALEAAGIEAAEVSLVEAVATSRTLVAESAGLSRSLRAAPPSTCALGSARATVGDAPGADLAGLARVALSLRERFVPSVPLWSAAGPVALRDAHAFYVPTESHPWIRAASRRRRSALVSLPLPDGRFAAAVVQEARGEPDQAPRPSLQSRRALLVPVVGEDERSLAGDLDALCDELRSASDPATVAAARLDRLAASGSSLVYALVARDSEEFRRELDRARSGIRRAFELGATWRTPSGSYFTPRPLGPGAKVAFVYPGMGSAFVGFGASLFQRFPRALARLESIEELDAADALGASALYPRSLDRLSDEARARASEAFARDARRVSSSSIAVSYVLTVVAQELGIVPQMAFGYSIGECSMYAALGVWPDLGALARRLGTSPTIEHRLGGSMRAVASRWGLADGEPVEWASMLVGAPPGIVVDAAAREHRAYIMTVNAPEQVMLGGDRAACRRIVAALGTTAFEVPFQLAIHCDVSRSEQGAIEAIHTLAVEPHPAIAFYSAASSTPVPQTSEAIAAHIARSYTHTVDFPRLVRRAYDAGARVFIEVGARANCTGWIERILADAPYAAVALCPEAVDEHTALVRAVAVLASHRVPFAVAPFRNASLAPPSTSEVAPAHEESPRAAALRARLCTEVARVLSIADPTLVPLDAPLGLDSLMILRVRAALQDEMGLELPLDLFWKHRTVRSLAAALATCAPAEVADRALASQVRSDSRAPGARYEASWAQRDMWVKGGDGDPRTFHATNRVLWVRSRIPVRGPLVPEHLVRAIHETFARHEILRSVVRPDAGSLWVEPLASFEPIVERIDGTRLAAADLDAREEEFFAELIDPVAGPPVRLALIARGPDDHVLCMTQHHLFTDGVSATLFWSELLERYRSHAEGRAPVEPAPAPTYREYCEAARRWLASEKSAPAVEFWRRELEGVTPIRLPFDRPRTAARDFDGGRLEIAVGAEVTRGLHAIATEASAGLFAVLLAALTETLRETTGQEDLLLVTFDANRTLPDFPNAFDVLGPTVAPLLLRCRTSVATPIERVRAAHATYTSAASHAVIPECLRRAVGLAVPIPQVSLLYQGFVPPRSVQVGPLTIEAGEPVGFGRNRAAFEIEIVVWPNGDGLAGLMTFATQVFSEPTARRLLDAFEEELRELAGITRS